MASEDVSVRADAVQAQKRCYYCYVRSTGECSTVPLAAAISHSYASQNRASVPSSNRMASPGFLGRPAHHQGVGRREGAQRNKTIVKNQKNQTKRKEAPRRRVSFRPACRRRSVTVTSSTIVTGENQQSEKWKQMTSSNCQGSCKGARPMQET